MNIDIQIKNKPNRSYVIKDTISKEHYEKKEHYRFRLLNDGDDGKNSKVDHIFSSNTLFIRPSLKGQVQSHDIGRLKLPLEI